VVKNQKGLQQLMDNLNSVTKKFGVKINNELEIKSIAYSRALQY